MTLEAIEIVAEAEAAGVEFVVADGQRIRIRYEPGRREELAQIIDRLRAHRGEVLEVLTGRCWHCDGRRTCECIACWKNGRSTCVACKGTGQRRGWVQ